MVEHTRRTFVKLGGAALGGIAVGSTVTAAESTRRFVVKPDAGSLDGADVSVVHDLSEVGLAVVEGAESDVANLGSYAPDTVYSLDLPVDPVPADDVGGDEARDEPYYPIQWDKQSQRVPDAQDVTRGEGSRVAIIDSGVAAGHPDIDLNTALSRNFTGDGYGAGVPAGGYHGTHCAGIVAAQNQNDVGVTGTAPDTELVDCRVFAANGGGASFGDILAAIVYSAAIGSDAANLSLGAYPISRTSLGSFYGKVLDTVTAYARRQGTLLVVAAGNDTADLQHDGGIVSLPNEAPNVVSVSATGPIGFNHGDPGLEEPVDTPAIYTNYGTNAVDLAAPGGNYDPAFPTGWYYDLVFNTIAEPEFDDDDGNYLGADYGYAWLAGTSMAAPQVAGAAALVRSLHPDWNANQVRERLKRTASDGPADKAYYGAGVLDTFAAVDE